MNASRRDLDAFSPVTEKFHSQKACIFAIAALALAFLPPFGLPAFLTPAPFAALALGAAVLVVAGAIVIIV